MVPHLLKIRKYGKVRMSSTEKTEDVKKGLYLTAVIFCLLHPVYTVRSRSPQLLWGPPPFRWALGTRDLLQIWMIYINSLAHKSECKGTRPFGVREFLFQYKYALHLIETPHLSIQLCNCHFNQPSCTALPKNCRSYQQ